MSGGVGVSCQADHGLAWMAWTTAVGVAEVLVGRVGEVALVSAFADRAKTGEALLLFGEPGAGEAALLDAAADAASQTAHGCCALPGWSSRPI